MFHEASSKLSAMYLGVIMAISIFFSLILYQVSVAEFNRDYSRQQTLLESSNLLPLSTDARNRFIYERTLQYTEAKQRLLVRLVIVNGIILVGGGFLSYYFARRTLRPIEEAHDSLERFTADASHELRTPITAMRTEIEVALSDPDLNLHEARQQLESNLEELGNLTQLSESLLQLARIDNNALPRHKVAIDDIISTALSQVKKQAARKATVIATTSLTPKQTVIGDKVSLSEVITILLENAVKYSPKGAKVTVTQEIDNNHVLVAISDNGPGIRKTDLVHIFKRFYRTDKARTKQPGAGYGLGLSIAQGIIHKHGGTITAESRYGHGSIFTISLPSA